MSGSKVYNGKRKGEEKGEIFGPFNIIVIVKEPFAFFNNKTCQKIFSRAYVFVGQAKNLINVELFCMIIKSVKVFNC